MLVEQLNDLAWYCETHSLLLLSRDDIEREFYLVFQLEGSTGDAHWGDSEITLQQRKFAACAEHITHESHLRGNRNRPGCAVQSEGSVEIRLVTAFAQLRGGDAGGGKFDLGIFRGFEHALVHGAFHFLAILALDVVHYFERIGLHMDAQRDLVQGGG